MTKIGYDFVFLRFSHAVFLFILLFFFLFYYVWQFSSRHSLHLASSSDMNDSRSGSSQGQGPGSLRNKLFSALGLNT